MERPLLPPLSRLPVREVLLPSLPVLLLSSGRGDFHPAALDELFKCTMLQIEHAIGIHQGLLRPEGAGRGRLPGRPTTLMGSSQDVSGGGEGPPGRLPDGLLMGSSEEEKKDHRHDHFSSSTPTGG